MTETTTVRANHRGDPCPPWCDTDHSQPVSGHQPVNHCAPQSVIQQGSRIIATMHGWRNGYGVDRTYIAIVAGATDVEGCHVPLEDAAGVAALIGYLATASPAAHHALAIKIREHAALIRESPAETPAIAG